MINRQPRSSAKKAKGEETRDVLISTGARLFALHGFNGLSMRTLARKAGVNLATISYHFGGKAGLYEAIIQKLVDVRSEIFPTPSDVFDRLEKAGDDKMAQCRVVSWMVNKLVNGILGNENHVWPVLIISRELAQPTQLYPKMEKEFFAPSFEALRLLVSRVLPQETDDADIVITAHAIIGMIVKILEGHELITKKLNWNNYNEFAVKKIAAILDKRIRGFLGLSMEDLS